VDRGVIDIAAIQEDRIGGIGHERFSLYPRHFMRWRFAPGQETDVALLVTHASPIRISLTGYNMTDSPITAELIMEDILPGIWKVTINNQSPHMKGRDLERFAGIPVTFSPQGKTVLAMELESPGKPYWERPDLGIDPEDVVIREDCIRVTVHSLGAAPTEAVHLVLRDPKGGILRSSPVPPLPAPSDLYPKKVEIPLWTRGIDLTGCSIEVDPERRMQEITRINNTVHLGGRS
jgi:hypothetical protein